MAAKSFVFRFADAEVREREFSLVMAGQTLPVEPKAFRVLLILLRNPKKLIPKEELLNAVWGDAAVTENSLARAIALLRRLLGDDAREPRFIETITSVGYRWLCPVEREEVSVEAADEPATQAAPEGAQAPPLPATAKSASSRRWVWITSAGAAVLLLAGGYWYLSRPLPPLRVTAFTQITNDGRLKYLAASDGKRLYFTGWSPLQLAQVGINGGEVARLPVAPPGDAMRMEDISSDGTYALVNTDLEGHPVEAQWLVPLLGGAVKRLEDGVAGAAFSPDASSVIYSTASGDVLLARIDGSGKRKLSSVRSPAYGFRWSPDGKWIRFFTYGDGLWEMAADGSGVHRLLANWKEGLPVWGNWTRDGKFYVFEADGRIWALDERRRLFRRQSTDPILLAGGPIRWDRPVPATDGSSTIFASGSKLRGELTRLDTKTGTFEPLLDGISAEFVSFSPDGNSVAYVAFPEGTLWVANRDASNRVQITRPPEFVINPRWSPDSKEIVFYSYSPGKTTSIHRISASDGTERWLPAEGGVDLSDPNWSSDGKKVVFKRGDLNSGDLSIADLTTRQISVVPESGSKWSPRWSPDGRYLAALPYPQVNHLQIFDLNLQRWSDLEIHGAVNWPCFSRDSRFIYFLGDPQSVFRVSVQGGQQERVFNMAGWHLTGHYGAFMSLDPTDDPLVLRDAGSDDFYALALEDK